MFNQGGLQQTTAVGGAKVMTFPHFYDVAAFSIVYLVVKVQRKCLRQLMHMAIWQHAAAHVKQMSH
eukprot:scaffold87675_cov43-Prasinocladus_malaysianus.AAC.1